MEFEAVLFDLDGTLLDTIRDLADSMNAVLSRLGLPLHDVDRYRYFVGDGMENLAIRALPEDHRTDDIIGLCVRLMRDEYSKRWDRETRPYRGIPEVLHRLNELGVPISVLSNKPDDFTRHMVAHFFPTISWAAVAGARPDVPHKPDPAGALAIAGQIGVRAERFAYVGDTNTDMATGRSAGMYPIGALWGFRTAEELAQSGARLIAAEPEDLLRIFLS